MDVVEIQSARLNTSILTLGKEQVKGTIQIGQQGVTRLQADAKFLYIRQGATLAILPTTSYVFAVPTEAEAKRLLAALDGEDTPEKAPKKPLEVLKK